MSKTTVDVHFQLPGNHSHDISGCGEKMREERGGEGDVTKRRLNDSLKGRDGWMDGCMADSCVRPAFFPDEGS